MNKGLRRSLLISLSLSRSALADRKRYLMNKGLRPKFCLLCGQSVHGLDRKRYLMNKGLRLFPLKPDPVHLVVKTERDT